MKRIKSIKAICVGLLVVMTNGEYWSGFGFIDVYAAL